MITIKNSWVAKVLGVDGIVLYPFIFFASKDPDQILINHELIHVSQIRRDGLWHFYFNYLKEYAIHRFQKKSHLEAYRSISYEVEAYDNQEKLS